MSHDPCLLAWPFAHLRLRRLSHLRLFTAVCCGAGPVIETKAIEDLAYRSYETLPKRPTASRPTGASISPDAPDSTGLGVPSSKEGHYHPDHWSRPHLPGVEVDAEGVWEHYPSVRWRPEGQ